jgi:hypothetical protein
MLINRLSTGGYHEMPHKIDMGTDYGFKQWGKFPDA